MLRHPCILRDPQCQARGVKSEMVPNKGGKKMGTGYFTRTFWGPKRGQQCYATPAISGIPDTGERNLKWLPHPCRLKGPKRGRKCYVTSVCSGIPNAKRREQNKKWPPTKAKKF